MLVAYFGLVSPSKGLDTLLDALELLAQDVRLLVIGGAASAAHDRPYAEQLWQRMRAGPLRERVTITGQSAAADVSGYLLAADVCALPFRDGASFRRGSLLAALAHGLPIATTFPQRQGFRAELAGLPELRDQANALLVPPDDAAALAGAIKRLAQSAELRLQLSQGGRALAQAFGWEAIGARHQELYQSLTVQARSVTI
jgi:glycosyltransferase involved in cell wall biosynthesis